VVLYVNKPGESLWGANSETGRKAGLFFGLWKKLLDGHSHAKHFISL
jgi:hypothetical protein